MFLPFFVWGARHFKKKNLTPTTKKKIQKKIRMANKIWRGRESSIRSSLVCQWILWILTNETAGRSARNSEECPQKANLRCGQCPWVPGLSEMWAGLYFHFSFHISYMPSTVSSYFFPRAHSLPPLCSINRFCIFFLFVVFGGWFVFFFVFTKKSWSIMWRIASTCSVRNVKQSSASCVFQ